MMRPTILALVATKPGPGRMLHLAEMAAVRDAHTRQPAEMRAQDAAYVKGRGLPEIEPLLVAITLVPL